MINTIFNSTCPFHSKQFTHCKTAVGIKYTTHIYECGICNDEDRKIEYEYIDNNLTRILMLKSSVYVIDLSQNKFTNLTAMLPKFYTLSDFDSLQELTDMLNITDLFS